MMTVEKMEIPDHVLDHMIKNQPREHRREVVEKIQKLEAALQVTGAGSTTWKEVLNCYRIRKNSVDAVSMAKSGITFFHQVVMMHAHDLDEALRRLKNFDPSEFMCEPVMRMSKSKDQRDKSEKAVAANQRKFEIRQEEITHVAQDALGKIKSDLLTKTPNWIVGKIIDEWDLQHQSEADTKAPSRNTIMPILKKLLPSHPKFQKIAVNHPGD